MLTSYGEEQTKVIALFRQCTMKDLSVLQSFSRKTFFETFADVNTTENMTAYLDKAFAPEKLRAELSDTVAAFYFLYWNASLAGYLKLNEAAAQTDIHDEQSLEIERIYICKDFQGAGAGRYLMDKAVGIAVQPVCGRKTKRRSAFTGGAAFIRQGRIHLCWVMICRLTISCGKIWRNNHENNRSNRQNAGYNRAAA